MTITAANFSKTELATILIVDSFLPTRMTASIALGMEGYSILTADEGFLALEIAQKQLPDIILIDNVLSGLNGFEVCRRLKSNLHTQHIPVIFTATFGARQDRMQAIEVGGNYFFTKPLDKPELLARVKSLIGQQKQPNHSIEHAQQVLFSIAQTIEHRDKNTGEHCDRLAALGAKFADFLKLSKQESRDLHWGAYLHDIGKVAIPDSILLKSGQLSAEEFHTMRQHTVIGENICQSLTAMPNVLKIIRHHHERWNGSGYPDNLAKHDIPFLAQVFQLLDVYDALVSVRPYKPSLSSTEALCIMQEETDKGWYNPELMAQFATFIEQFTDRDTHTETDAFSSFAKPLKLLK